MKAVIIDDEERARRLLQVLIEENCPKISEVFQAESLLKGVEIIKEEQPELVFLDIEMPGHSGLEILDFIDKDDYNFEIIFTTAYSEYAIKAIELSALDYILKPVRASKLKTAVDKALKFIGRTKLNERFEALSQALTSKEFKKIGLPVKDGVEFVNFEDIVMLEAERMYTNIYINEQKIPMLISKPLKYFVDLLQHLPFFYKPHRSYYVNLKYITKYVKSDGGYIVMDNGKQVSLSKEKTEEFMQLMQQL